MDREVGRLAIHRHARDGTCSDEFVRFRLAVYRRWEAKLLAVILIRERDPTIRNDPPRDRKGDAPATDQVNNPVGFSATDLALTSNEVFLKAGEPITIHGSEIGTCLGCPQRGVCRWTAFRVKFL
jgi:hypothetical protein